MATDADIAALLEDVPDAEDVPPPPEGAPVYVGKPHFRFDPKGFRKALWRIAALFGDAREAHCRCILLRPSEEPGFARAHVNTGEHAAYFDIPLLNTDRVMQKSFVTEFKALSNLVKESSGDLAFVDEGETVKIRLLGGTVALENYHLERRILDYGLLRDPAPGTPVSDPQGFLAFVALAQKTAVFAAKPEEKRIRLSNGTGQAMFASAAVVFTGVPAPDLSFRFADAPALLRLLEGKDAVTVLERKADYLVRASGVAFTLPRLKTDDLSGVEKAVKAFTVRGAFPVRAEIVKRAAKLVWGVMGSLGQAKLRADHTGLRLRAFAKTGRTVELPLSDAPAPEAVEIRCPLQSLYQTAGLLPAEGEGTVSLAEGGRIVAAFAGLTVVFGSAYQ